MKVCVTLPRLPKILEKPQTALALGYGKPLHKGAFSIEDPYSTFRPTIKKKNCGADVNVGPQSGGQAS
jgi:hypothetical protein